MPYPVSEDDKLRKAEWIYGTDTYHKLLDFSSPNEMINRLRNLSLLLIEEVVDLDAFLIEMNDLFLNGFKRKDFFIGDGYLLEIFGVLLNSLYHSQGNTFSDSEVFKKDDFELLIMKMLTNMKLCNGKPASDMGRALEISFLIRFWLQRFPDDFDFMNRLLIANNRDPFVTPALIADSMFTAFYRGSNLFDSEGAIVRESEALVVDVFRSLSETRLDLKNMNLFRQSWGIFFSHCDNEGLDFRSGNDLFEKLFLAYFYVD